MASESRSAIFSGLRFLLAGFERTNKTQYADAIIESNGEVADKYDSSITHVVVCNLPESDSICKTARKDGKILVTDFWMADCFNSDTLCTPDSVLYKPPKVLGGISGANALLVCLTGYERPERSEVMRMVELMGAKFTKSLLIHSVTHLVCFKFEGEKYNVAKKNGLFLVNHFWLQDCLKAWSLLPESDYAISGSEAEALRLRETVVEDSLEGDITTTENQQVQTSSSSGQIYTSLSDNQPHQSARIEEEDKLNGSALLAKSDPLSPKWIPPAADQGERVQCDAGHVEDVSVPVDMFQSTNAPADHGAVVNALPDVERDETTDIDVDDRDDASEHSSRHSPLQDDNENANSRCFDTRKPGNITTRSRNSKVPEAAESGRKRSMDDVKNFEAEDRAASDAESQDSESKRSRQSAQPADIFSKRTSISFDDAKDVTPQFIEEELAPCVDEVLNQDVAVLQDHVMSDPSDAPKLKKVCSKPSQNDECKLEVDITSASGRGSRHGSNVGEDVAEADEERGAESEVDLDSEVAANGREVGHSKNTDGSASVFETEATDTKHKGSPGVGRPATLAELARSYKPTSRKKTLSKKNSGAKEKENISPGDAKQVMQSNDLTKTDTKKKEAQKGTHVVKPNTLVPAKFCFAVGGTTEERDRLHCIIKSLGGKICRSRHQWRDEATHLVLPGPLRRTEKFLAGAAAGRWILKPEYLEASREAGTFLSEDAFEWTGEGLNDKGSISLEAPRKWRLYCAERGIGPFAGLRVVFYGECISPALDTYKRAIKAGGGEVLATSPPYSLHLEDGANFAIISPRISQEDNGYVAQFLKHGLGCVTSSYFVDLVCHPESSLDRHILFGTEDAVKAARRQMDATPVPPNKSKISAASRPHKEKNSGKHTEDTQDTACSLCGRLDGEAFMLLCGDDKGAGCGIGTHTFCCTPALEKVPEDDWFCSQCRV